MEIPPQLKKDEFRFVLIAEEAKNPFETGWQNDSNYSHDDLKLKEHLENGGNYGVACGYGNLVVIDADRQKVADAVSKHLPKTFTVRTGGGGLHFYYVCGNLDKPVRLSQNEAGDLGDVQYEGKQVVGPGSIHPNGNKYEIELDKEIAKVKASEIKFALRKWIKDGTSKAKSKKKYDEQDLVITDVVDTSELRESGNELYGAHPIHGSKTDRNFWVNTGKNIWHCFRHDSGGGPLLWLAVRGGIIDCEDACPGALKGEKWIETIDIAREKGLISEEEAAEYTNKVKELVFDFEVKEEAGKFVVGVGKNEFTISIKNDNGKVIYPETDFKKDFHSDQNRRNELKKELKKAFDLDVQKDESEAVSVINELCTFLQEKDLGYYGDTGYEKGTRGDEEGGSVGVSFKSVSELLDALREKYTPGEENSDPSKGVNGNQQHQSNQKVYSLGVGDRRTVVEFEAEVSGEEGDTAAYIPKKFECPQCGATKSNDYLKEDPLQEVIARSFGSDSAPSCPVKDCNSIMEPMEDETVWFHVYKIWAQHPLMEQDKPHQRQRQLRIIRPVDEPEEESHGLLRIRGIPATFEMGDEKRLGVVALDAEPVDFTLREEFELDEKYEERFREVFPEIGQEKIDRTIAPQVTGRELEKEFIALLQHSPLYLPNGEFGLLNVLLAGDDTTAKTPICQDLHENLSPAGSEYTDENTTVAGLVGGAERGRGGWSITWGALARADCGLTITEGLHAFTQDMLAKIREALKSKIARIQKIHHAIRPCRSRILGTINTSVPTEYMATKFQALNHLGLDGGPQMSRIDLSRWHTVLVFGRKDVSLEQIDKHKAKMADGFERPIGEDVWKKHVLWSWWISSDPDNTTVEDGVSTETQNTLEKWREKYRFSDLMILGPKGFDIFYSFVISSAYLHHRAENGKVKVVEEDVDYITDLFERYFENIGLDEHERMKEEELSFADELIEQLTQNQKKLLMSLSEGSKPRSEVADELGIAPQSVSRMLHQREEYDSATGEKYYSGAELIEGKRALIRKRGNDYELTDYGWMVVSNYLLEEESSPETGTKKLDTMDRNQKDKADALREIVNGFEKDEFPEGTLFVVAEEEGIEKEFVREWLKRESQGKDSSISYSEEEGMVRDYDSEEGVEEVKEEIEETLEVMGAMTIEEVREELDYGNVVFNQAWNQLVEEGTIVETVDGAWNHKKNLPGV